MQNRAALAARQLGPVSIVALLIAYVTLWVLLKPTGELGFAYLGQLVGVVSARW